MPRYWVIAPVESKPAELFDKVWQFDLDNSLISIGWDAIGDVSMLSREALSNAVARSYPDKPPSTKSLIGNMLWDFWHEIVPGDFVIARRGRTVLAAVGKVVRAGSYAPGKNPFLASPGYSHQGFLEVEWQKQPRNKDFGKNVFLMQTVKEISEAKFLECSEEDSIPSNSQPTFEPIERLKGSNAFALEKYLQEFIASNFDTIFKGSLQMYADGTGADGQQFDTYEIGKIDILAVEPASNSFVVIELKRGSSSDQVIGQTLRYMGWVRENLCKGGQTVRGLIICLESDPKLNYAIKMINNIEVRYYEVKFELKETA